MMSTTTVQQQVSMQSYCDEPRTYKKNGQTPTKTRLLPIPQQKDNDMQVYVAKIENWLKQHPEKIKALYSKNNLGVKEVIESRGFKQRQVLLARYGGRIDQLIDTVVRYLQEKYRPPGEGN